MRSDRGQAISVAQGVFPARSGWIALCPHRYCRGGVTEIAVDDLRQRGIRAVLLDLDNTLVGWQRSDLTEPVIRWIDELKSAGFRLYMVSNTRSGRRIQALSERLGIPFTMRAWKPRAYGFQEALAAMGVEPTEAVMIGDQMFTDVLGANRLGMYTVMVPPLARREFIGTKISRMVEWALLCWFRATRRLEP